MPYKNKDDLRKYRREWYRRKRRGETTRLYPKPTEKERIRRKKARRDRYRKKLFKEKVEITKEVLGEGCFLCKRKNTKIVRHRKDGRKHKDFSGMSLKVYDKEIRSEKYVLLCWKCHESIHWIMKYLGMGWGEISKKYIETFNKSRRGKKHHERKEV